MSSLTIHPVGTKPLKSDTNDFKEFLGVWTIAEGAEFRTRLASEKIVDPEDWT